MNVKGQLSSWAMYAAVALLFAASEARAQSPPEPPDDSLQSPWTAQQSGTRESLRGLSIVNERVVWASGNRGTFVRTTDAGMTWKADTIPGATSLDFRDVHAFSADAAVVLSAGADARVYHTGDGGRTWALAYSNRAPGVFFDGLAFWDASHGIAYSDPVNGRFLLIATSDGGRSWREIPSENFPRPLESEASYAASGTGIVVTGKSHVWFGTGGGERTRVFHSSDRGHSWTVADVPMAAGGAGAGIYSLVFVDSLRGVAVGGNYQQASSADGNAAFTIDGGRTWTAVAEQAPRGYRSVVTAVPGTPAPTLIASGTSGTDYSVDGGRTWSPLSDEGFNAVAFASAAAGWAVGDRGRISKFSAMVPIVRR
jgi:photosystem II stability/assembly factor-like uncharacterized protein